MALVKYGGGIVQMSGSIGGDTFARNRYGNYVRARTKPVNPNTTLQQAVRASMSFLTNRWAQTLDAAQRTAWNPYAQNEAMQKKKLQHYIALDFFTTTEVSAVILFSVFQFYKQEKIRIVFD